MTVKPQPQINPYSALAGQKLVVAIPSGRAIEAHTALSLAGLSSYTSLHGVRLAMMSEIRSVISAARNALVVRAASIDPDWILFIDADMMFPPDAALRLMSHNLDVVCGTYNKRSPPFDILGHLTGEKRSITGGLHEADFMPGGMMLIRYSVLKALSYPWFFETYEWETRTKSPVESFIRMIADWSYIDLPMNIRGAVMTNPAFAEWLDKNQAIKTSSMDPESIIISEDYNFCRKVRKAGVKIFCDFDLSFQLGHIGERIVTLEPAPPELAPADLTATPEAKVA